MNRRLVGTVLAVLLVATPVRWAHAQTGNPPPQASSSETTHIVQRGETLFTIAQQYGVTVDSITRANRISDPRQVYVSQRLVIPSGGSAPQAAVPYLIQAGDTLVSVARRYRTTWQTLVQINRLLSPNTLYVGQIIQVPTHDSNDTQVESSQLQAGGDLLYVVRPGDTPSRIALRYGLSLRVLATINHLTSPALVYPGQELLIPGAGPSSLPVPFISIDVQPLPAIQGSTLIVAVQTTEPVTLSGRLIDRKMPFAAEGGAYYGLIGLDARWASGLYELELTATDDQGQETAVVTGIVIQSRDSGYARVALPPSNNQSAYAIDRERLDPLRSLFTPERHWTVPLQRPCRGTISDYFGVHRAYNDGPYTSYHTGVDYRAPTGAPVYAPAGGIVVLAERLAVWGNAIVIDHGWGLLTGYAHLSAIEVQVGQQVAAGDQIGRVGTTGASTGSHLHWEVWVGGTPVDGLQWLEEFYPWPESATLSVGG